MPEIPIMKTILALTFAATSITAVAADWPQFRGPSGTGEAPDANPPTTWSESSNLKWKIKLPGGGAGTPIVSGEFIFIQTAISTGKKVEPAIAAPQPEAAAPRDDAQRGERPRGSFGGGRPGGFGRGEAPKEVQQFAVLCLERATGKTLWQKVVKEELPHEGHHRDHGFASHTPVTDGTNLYAWFGSRGLHCLDFKGNVKWSVDFGDMRTRAGFGEGNSVALHGDTIAVQWDHEGEDDFIAALDKNTGKELWRQKRSEATTWSSPLIITADGKSQVVTSATDRIRSYDLATGAQLWECSGMTANVIPTPVTGHGMVYAISGFRGASLLAIPLGKTGDLTESGVAWKHGKSTPYVPSPLLAGSRLYFHSGNNPMLSCFDAKTGKPHYEATRMEGATGVYASPVSAAGRIYLTGRNGAVQVIKDSDTFESISVNKLDEQFDASPAICGKEIFLRGHEYLYCIAEK